MVVRKTHLYMALAVIVIVAAYFVQRYQNQQANKLERNANIALCMASVERSSYIANGFRILAHRVEARDAKGDKQSAQNYDAVADSIVGTFPGIAKADSRVDRIEMFDGTIRYHIPDEGRDKERTGCTSAFSQPPSELP